MRTFRGSLLIEAMLCLVFVGILLPMGSVSPPRAFSGSREESPVVLMGILNEEMRDSSFSMKSNQIRIENQLLVHLNSSLQVKKRTYIDEDVRVYYGSTFDPRFTSTTSFGFLIRGLSAQSGKISFYRQGKVECVLMVHLGTLTMDVRAP